MVDSVTAEEEKAEASRIAADQLQQTRVLHESAGVLALDDSSLFQKMIKGDVEGKVLLRLPGADKLLSRY